MAVPCVALGSAFSLKLRGWLLTAMVFSTVLGDSANINFLSTESYRGPDRGFEVNLTDLLAWGLGLGLLLKPRGRLLWFPFNSMVLAAALAWALLCTVSAPEPLMASFTLFKLVKLFVLYWVTVNLMACGSGIEHYMNGAFAIGALMTVLAVKQKYLDGYYRIPGPFDHSNTIPIFLLQLIPAVLLWGLCRRPLPAWKAALWLFCALGMTFAVAATQSRAGLAVAGLCLSFSLLLANRRFPSRRVAFSSFFLALLCILGAAKAADTVAERFRSAPKASEEARHEFNHAAEMMAGDHWNGVGLNSFSMVLTHESRYNAHIVVMANEEHAGVAHHFYLLTAAETGYAGLALALLVLLRFGGRALQAGWRNRKLEATLAIGLAMGFGAVHVLGFLEWALRISPVCYLLTLGSAAATELAR